jgi:hypothetical protein
MQCPVEKKMCQCKHDSDGMASSIYITSTYFVYEQPEFLLWVFRIILDRYFISFNKINRLTGAAIGIEYNVNYILHSPAKHR